MRDPNTDLDPAGIRICAYCGHHLATERAPRWAPRPTICRECLDALDEDRHDAAREDRR